jgi:uncharacterized small protein (DUF1192 family)
MNGCMCGCGGWGYSPKFSRRATQQDEVEWLEECQRDLEQRIADVADEIKRLKATSQPTS